MVVFGVTASAPLKVCSVRRKYCGPAPDLRIYSSFDCICRRGSVVQSPAWPRKNLRDFAIEGGGFMFGVADLQRLRGDVDHQQRRGEPAAMRH